MHQNTWKETLFTLTIDPLYLLLALTLVLIYYIYQSGKWINLIVPAIFVLFFRGWGRSVGLAFSCLFLVAVLLRYADGLRETIFWVICLLSLFEFLSWVHWAILYPLGIDSFIKLALIENQLFYVTVHLSPYLYILFNLLQHHYISSWRPEESCYSATEHRWIS